MYKIYCHIFPNGKRYIGLTKMKLEQRWDNGKSYKTCLLVDRAIKKYGWENVQHVVLATVENKEEAEEIERKYIAHYKSDNVEFGYNILPGGNVATNELTDEMRYKLGNGWRGKHRSNEDKHKIGEGVKKRFERPESNGHYGMKHTNETKEKMSISQKKAWESENRKKRASESMKNRMKNPEFKAEVLNRLRTCERKYVVTEEQKKKLSERMKGRWLNENSPTSKPVLQFDKEGNFIKRWANGGEAERAGIALRGNISKCCLHFPHCKTAGGYIWEYEQK